MIHWAKRALPAVLVLVVLASVGGGFHWGNALRVIGG